MKKVSTPKGFLVIVNNTYGCYVDKDYNFMRSLKNDVQTEITWAKEKWTNYEETEFPKDKEQYLLNQLQYVQDYKDSLETVEP